MINLVVTDADGSGNSTLEIVGGNGRAAFTVVGGTVEYREITYCREIEASPFCPRVISEVKRRNN